MASLGGAAARLEAALYALGVASAALVEQRAQQSKLESGRGAAVGSRAGTEGGGGDRGLDAALAGDAAAGADPEDDSDGGWAHLPGSLTLLLIATEGSAEAAAALKAAGHRVAAIAASLAAARDAAQAHGSAAGSGSVRRLDAALLDDRSGVALGAAAQVIVQPATISDDIDRLVS